MTAPARVYVEGEPDPTPNLTAADLGQTCLAEHVRLTDQDDTVAYACTWRVNHHPSQHVAGDGATIVAVWPVA